MKIPKKIDTLLKKRTKLAQDLLTACSELDTWLESTGVDLGDSKICDAVISGVMIYCEPKNAEIVVRSYIENYM